MSLIETLTSEQQKQFEICADRWIKMCLSTEPANRPETEEGIKEFCKWSGISPPQKIIWGNSPLLTTLANIGFFMATRIDDPVATLANSITDSLIDGINR